jgi:trk/ktr system potassium uptake protein
MRILIAGAGQAGLSVAAHLRAAGHEVTVLDRDPLAARQAFEKHGLSALAGDATDAHLLEEADVERADVVVAMLRRDADNLAVALLARAAGAKRVMVRMRDAAYRPVYLGAGVQRILSEIDVLVGAFATAVEHEAVRHAMVLGGGGSVAFELSLPEGAAVAGQTVSAIASSPGFPPSCVFAGMYEAGGAFEAPRGASVVRASMTLLLVARRDELAHVIAFFMRPRAA